MWNLWRLLGAQRCIFPTSVHMSLCFSNSFESLEPKNTIVPRHFSVGCYTGVCRSSPPLSWSVCVRVCLNIWLPVSLEPLEIATLDGCASASPSPLSSVTHKLELISFGQSADQIWLEASEASLTLFITSVIVPLHSFALSIWPILLLVDSLLKSLSRFFFPGKWWDLGGECLFLFVSLKSPVLMSFHSTHFSFCFSWYVCRWLASSVAWETWVLAH